MSEKQNTSLSTTGSVIDFHNMLQRSEEWHNIRIGRVGGSEAIGLTTPARMKTMAYSKLGELLSGEQKAIKPNEAMQRGIDLEPMAKEMYEQEEMVSVDEVGYITNSFYKYMGLSPDGLVGNVGAVEIKCPSSAKHVKTIIENVVPKEYIPQIVTYFLVNEDIQWVDFISYDDRIKRLPYYRIRLNRLDLLDEINSLSENYTKYENIINEHLKLF